MPLKINSTNGSVTLTPIDGVGNVDITVPRGNIVSEDYAGELVVDSYNERYSAVTSSSNATTVNCEDANSFSHTLTENTTFTFSNPPASGTAYTFSIEIIQDASASGYTVTWPTAVDWPSATAPTLTATASAKDMFVFYTRDGGTNWYGFVAGQALGQVMATKKKLLQVSGGGEDSYWIALLGSSSAVDLGWGVAVDSSNNIISVGYTSSDGAGANDCLIAKYDSEGSVLWDRTLGGSSTDRFYGVVTDSSNNIYATGRAWVVAATNSYRAITAKYNSSGAIQWQKTLGLTSEDYSYKIAVDSSDNVVICGKTNSDGAGSNDFLIAKYNSSGVLQWDRTLGGTGTEIGYGVAIDSSDNIIISGYTASQGAGGNDAVVAKYNSSGTIQWQRRLGGSSNDYFYGVAIDSSDDIILSGQTFSQGLGSGEGLLVKYNSSGTIQWQKRLGGTANDFFYSVALDSQDNIFVVGGTQSDGEGSGDMLIAKYNSSGTIQWQKAIGTTGGAIAADYARGVAVDSKNNLIISGYADLTISASTSEWVITAKLPPDGSGDGTYGDLTYQDITLTAATSTLTEAAATLTDAAAVLTDSSSSFTDAAAVLTETLYIVT